MTYSEKLKDPRWQQLSAHIKERADWRCQRCGTSDSMLSAHHRTYERGKDPWDYEDTNFECLCVKCHDAVEMYLAGIRSAAAMLPNARLASFAVLAQKTLLRELQRMDKILKVNQSERSDAEWRRIYLMGMPKSKP